MASSIASIERELWHSQGARKIIAANHKTLSNFLQYHTIHQRILLSTYRRILLQGITYSIVSLTATKMYPLEEF